MTFLPVTAARRLALALAGMAVLGASAVHAGPFGLGGHRQSATTASPAGMEDIQRSLDEGRLMDAGVLIDQATAAGVKDPRLHVMAGELGLKRGANDLAIRDFRAAQASPETKARGLQGE